MMAITFLTPPLSLTAMTSRGESSRPCQHRKKLRPIRPNPLIATLSLATVSPFTAVFDLAYNSHINAVILFTKSSYQWKTHNKLDPCPNIKNKIQPSITTSYASKCTQIHIVNLRKAHQAANSALTMLS